MNIARAAQRARLRIIIPALAVAIAALIIPSARSPPLIRRLALPPAAGPGPPSCSSTGRANTASWAAVIQRLQADGYTVYAPPNPLQGLTYDSAYLADFLHSISGPIVLVGHSYGGDVITNAATGDTQVKALVYVDAFAPAQNQTLAQLLAAYLGSCAEPSNLTVVPFPGAPAGTGDAYITQSAFPSCMANELPAREAQVLAADQAPLATIALTQPSGVPAWKTIPSWAVVGTADHAIPANVAAGHGRERTRPHHRSERPAPGHDLRPRRRDQRHPAGRPGHRLTRSTPPASTSPLPTAHGAPRQVGPSARPSPLNEQTSHSVLPPLYVNNQFLDIGGTRFAYRRFGTRRGFMSFPVPHGAAGRVRRRGRRRWPGRARLGAAWRGCWTRCWPRSWLTGTSAALSARSSGLPRPRRGFPARAR